MSALILNRSGRQLLGSDQQPLAGFHQALLVESQGRIGDNLLRDLHRRIVIDAKATDELVNPQLKPLDGGLIDRGLIRLAQPATEKAMMMVAISACNAAAGVEGTGYYSIRFELDGVHVRMPQTTRILQWLPAP